MTICVLCCVPFDARTSYGLCPLCYSKDRLREYDRVESSRHHALRNNLPATLTLQQWLACLSDFAGLCSYCGLVPFSVIEIVDERKGLSHNNVVPSCRVCSHYRKQPFEQAEIRVRQYLARTQPLLEIVDECELFDEDDDAPGVEWVSVSEM
jgi:hypothetical protein